MLFAFTTKDTKSKHTTVYITAESSLSVVGSTNVNSFTCCFDINKLKNPIPVYYQITDDKMVFKNTVLTLNNSCFDCGNNGMNKDFQKLLKTETTPQIFLNLKEINSTNNDACILATVEIEIAGVKRAYKVPVTALHRNELVVTGSLDLYLSDFKLEPPKKVLGLIAVKDTIKIAFQLIVNEQV